MRILTADITLAELSSKLARRDRAASIPDAVDVMIQGSDAMVGIGRDDALRCGPLLVELRKRDPDASLIDATLLSVARNRGAILVSCDPAFRGQPDVVCEGGDEPRKRTRRPAKR